jgi:hypothetical protein
MRKRFGQGRRPLHATLAVVAVGLGACSPEEPVPAQMARPVYETQDACLQDWSASDCTAQADAATSGSTTGGSTTGGHGGLSYFGPFMHGGYYYPAAGGYRSLPNQPLHESRIVGAAPSSQAAEGFRSRVAVTRGGLGSSASTHFGGG